MFSSSSGFDKARINNVRVVEFIALDGLQISVESQKNKGFSCSSGFFGAIPETYTKVCEHNLDVHLVMQEQINGCFNHSPLPMHCYC